MLVKVQYRGRQYYIKRRCLGWKFAILRKKNGEQFDKVVRVSSLSL